MNNEIAAWAARYD